MYKFSKIYETKKIKNKLTEQDIKGNYKNNIKNTLSKFLIFNEIEKPLLKL